MYNRFARGEDVFADPEEAVEFSELLREVKQRGGLTIHAWALLFNHFHPSDSEHRWVSDLLQVQTGGFGCVGPGIRDRRV